MKKFIIFISILFCFFTQFCLASDNVLPSQIGKVLDVHYEDTINTINNENAVKQSAKILIISGDYKGQTIELDNMITGNPAYDINLKKNDKVILHAESNIEDIRSIDDINYFIADIKRDNVICITALGFCLLLLIIGRKKGLFSLISILATIGLIFFLLVPLILNGISPLFATVITCIFSTIITIYLVGGFNSKSTSAIIGTIISLILAGILSLSIIHYARLTGFTDEDSLFLYTANSALNFTGILASAMLIAALGALMDTAISIASTINEIHETDKTLGVKNLFKSGMNVGRDIIGTMSNTLILVYTGSSLPLILLSQNIDLQKFFNLNQVATEIMSALIGSIAILACVPITAFIASFLIKYKKQDIKFNFDD